MRFCFITTQKEWGGGEALCAELAVELEAHCHTTAWIGPRGCVTVSALERKGLSILHQFAGRGRSFREIRRLTTALRNWSPDVLVMNDPHATVLGGLAALRLRRPRPVRLAMKHTVFPLRSPMKYRMLCDQVVCVSNAARAKAIDAGLPAEHTVVVYGGVREPVIDNSADKHIREALGVADHQIMILSVGNLLACKGHRDLIEAIKRLPARDSIQVFIAGEGKERSFLEALVADSGLTSHVHLLGFRDDVPALMQAADLLVHPSHAEGLSLVLIQAQMMRRPIVATAVGGAAEVLAAGQRPGLWTVPPGDVPQLAQALEDACQAIRSPAQLDLLMANLEKARAYCMENFSIDRCAARFTELAAEWIERR